MRQQQPDDGDINFTIGAFSTTADTNAATASEKGTVLKKRVKLTRKAFVDTRKEFGDHQLERLKASEEEYLGDSELSGDEDTLKRRKVFHLLNDI